jgi:hypothetical protein
MVYPGAEIRSMLRSYVDSSYASGIFGYAREVRGSFSLMKLMSH